MPYGRRGYGGVAVGDPFLGGLFKGIKKVAGFAGKFVPGPIGTGLKIVGGLGGRAPRRVAAPPPGVIPFMGPVTTPRGSVQIPGAPGRRRRMNFANQKALRRSLRRVTGYARQQKAIRKAASEFAREFGPKRRAPRRDLGRGHVHVR